MILWPPNLPLPSFQSYAINPQDGFIRTSMDGGIARQRRRFTQSPTVVSVKWIMSTELFSLFEAWYAAKIENGAQWFHMKVSSGVGIESQEVRFTQSYRARPLSDNRWDITASLEARHITVISGLAFDFLEAGLSPDDLTAQASAFDTFVNSTYPNYNI